MKIGAKADNLLVLRTQFPDNVPPFEVVPFKDLIVNYQTVHSQAQQLVDEALLNDINTKKLQLRIKHIAKIMRINSATIKEIFDTAQKNQWTKISIRTSALTEDGVLRSFAGQYVSFVDKKPQKNQLERCIRRCFMSLFSERVIRYAQSQKMNRIEIGGSVIVQKMFYGDRSGVLFTENGRGDVTFAITNSWRNSIVEGGDAIMVTAPRTTLYGKDMTSQLRIIAELGIELEKHLQASLDIEWSYDGQNVMLLQARPQTTDTTIYSLTWDATNISENYPGITLPLTYSFIRNLYANVYPSFFRLMGVREKKLRENKWVFDNTLGYIDGRVYYRIDNWYKIVKLIPGSRNQEFFEAMLNPAKKRNSHAKQKRIPISASVIMLSIRFAWLLLRSKKYSKKFSHEFTLSFKEINRLNWSAMSAETCLDELQSIQQKLLTLWSIPILNDIRVMIFHGIFKTIIMKGASQKAYLENLRGLDDRASIKPLEAIYKLGQKISDSMEIEGVTTLSALKQTSSWRSIEQKAQKFIEIFGGRTPDELQLENPRLGDNLSDIISLAYASKDSTLDLSPPKKKPMPSFAIHKKIIARYVIKNMRSAIDYRERFRFNRAQIFGVSRSAYLAIGQKLAAVNVIELANDVFWLTEQEVEAVVRGHSWEYDMKKLVKHRKKTHVTYSQKPLRLRINGQGIIAPLVTTDTTLVSQSNAVSGVGVAPGRVTAPVVVVHTFNPELDIKGKILVVRHVDPGWTLLLVQAAGVISERGNALSHVAIVSREISVPAIVGVKDAVDIFKTGQKISMDGTTGEVDYVS